jgi:hypothetical protein
MKQAGEMWFSTSLVHVFSLSYHESRMSVREKEVKKICLWHLMEKAPDE